MNKLQQLEKRVQSIENRNKKVELDKAWETSLARRLLLIIFTYLAIALYMKFILNVDPWLNAIIPTLGFFLSTLTLPYFKKIWEKFINKR